MIVTRKIFNKEKGRQFIHLFPRCEDISPRLANRISLKLIEEEKFKNFEILVVTHIDKKSFAYSFYIEYCQ